MSICDFEGHCWHVSDNCCHTYIYHCCGCGIKAIMPKGKEPEDGYIVGTHTRDETGP